MAWGDTTTIYWLWSAWHVPSPSYVIFWKMFHLKHTEAEVAWLAGVGEREKRFIYLLVHCTHFCNSQGWNVRTVPLSPKCVWAGMWNQEPDMWLRFSMLMLCSAPTHHALLTTERVTKQESENGTLGFWVIHHSCDTGTQSHVCFICSPAFPQTRSDIVRGHLRYPNHT